MTKLYRDKQWIEFRESIFEMDGHSCVNCYRSPPEVVLQVHHKYYEREKPPWDYPLTACESLCMGCHAREHGIIRPSEGWSLYAQDDLEGLYGECECCGTSLRHVFYIQHENWEPMAVGTDCCDNLTGTTKATEHRKLLERKNRFLTSKRWRQAPLGLFLKHGKLLQIEIQAENGKYRIHINGVPGRKIFTSEIEAKIFVFELIQSGKANKFAKRYPMKNKHSVCA